MVSINPHLARHARELFISNPSTERAGINKSFHHFRRNLKLHFAKTVSNIKPFGSFTRGTILPRHFDSKSDIDILILLNQEEYQRTPETYRANLLSFAEKYYQRSSIRKDFPTVVIELNHINFDLVPAKIERFSWGPPTVFIPDSQNEWQDTDPDGFNRQLSKANQRYGSIVKPIIRLLKYWNATHNYPYESFALEQEISEMNFRGGNLQNGFFYAINNLDTFFPSNNIQNAVEALTNNANKVVYYLSQNDRDRALSWLKHILP